VVAFGLPAPQGSKRHVGNGVMVESSKHVKPWREAVKHAALLALEEQPDWDRSVRAVGLHVIFTFPRPRAHYRTGKHSHQLRDAAPHLHANKPDLDKLLRSTMDALRDAGCFADDCRVAQVYALKSYPLDAEDPWPHPIGVLDRPGAHLTLQGDPGARA
jgi:crossover junction endodeoxyribonuclease RusA